tara:strand:+ start:2733 stop:4394 length:1662 start_codon:yes stop_codon:yes gene_type:complete
MCVFTFGCDQDNKCGADQPCANNQICVLGECQVPTTDVTGSPDTTTTNDTGAQDTGTSTDVQTQQDSEDDTGALDILLPDTTGPEVVSITPNDGTADVALTTSIVVTFNEPMKANYFTTNSVQLRNANGGIVEGVFTFNDDFTEATFQPAEPLHAATPYQVLITTILTDLAGNAVVKGEQVTFTTAIPEGMSDYRTLARIYAPVVILEIPTAKPEFEIPTRVDLTGEWSTELNSSFLNFTGESFNAAVYWSVIETKTHYFINYMYYWPLRDTELGAAQDVENDTAGAMVVVRKGTIDPEILVTVFSTGPLHTEFVSFSKLGANLLTEYDENTFDHQVTAAQWFTEEGDIHDFRSFIPAHSHQSCLWEHPGTFNYCELNPSLRTAINTRTLEWSDAPTQIVREDGQWNIPDSTLGYEPVSLLEALWLHRLVDADSTVWQTEATYQNLPANRPGNGTLYPANFAKFKDTTDYAGRPSWAWRWKSALGAGQEDLARGLAFFDPAWFVAWRHITDRKINDVVDTWITGDGTSGYSLEYCFNPFLNIDIRQDDPTCGF